MPPHWKDLHAPETQQWVGLEFTVGPRPRPTWRVEAADGRHLRLTRDGRPLLWAQVAPGYAGVRWLLGDAEHPGCLPPLQSGDIEPLNESPSGPPGGPAWFAAWARHFTRVLDSAPHSPLYAGTWRLMRAGPFVPGTTTWPPGREQLGPDVVDGLDAGGPRAFAADEHFGISVRTPLLGLRLEAHLSPSRLKVWRKRARDGTLPPVLALYVSPLSAYVVLDGHHRWRAARDEQRPVPLLALSPIRWREHSGGRDSREHQRVERIFHERTNPPEPSDPTRWPISVARLNELALRAWDNGPFLQNRTRAWPQPGGLAAWRTEVRARLADLASDLPSELAESFLSP